jgi:hypothetical protein
VASVEVFFFSQNSFWMSSSALLSLPVEILNYIIQYLRQNDIGALDSASTNLSGRERFLLALNRSEIWGNLSFNQNFDSKIRWQASRGTIITFLRLENNHFQLHDHPCLPQLIRNSQERILEINFTSLHFYSKNNKHELMLALGKCVNIQRCMMMLCTLPDSDLISCLNNKKYLRDLKLYSVSGLSSASIQAISIECPNLTSITFSDISCVSDQEISAIINGCRSLEWFQLDGVNITDESMKLLIQTNCQKEIVRWDNCPRVTWEGKLFYVRELSFIQLLSNDPGQQTRGIDMINQ